MAFCGNCGTQLQGDERFCVACGKDLKPAGATTAAAPANPAASVPTLPTQPFAAQPVAAAPGQYAAPGPIPIAIAVPPAQAKHGGRWGSIILLLALGGAGYYYYTHRTPPAPPVDNATLTKQQAFDAHWDAINGFIQISNGKWTNNSQVPVQSATLECDQYDAAGTNLDQMRTTLNGPLQPGATDNFNPFQMGAVANNLNRVTCSIVHVKQPAAPGQ
jgi:hypothetical protein